MTVSSEQSRVQYATDGVATSFPVPFRFLSAQHLRVSFAQGEDDAVELVLGRDFDAAGAGNASGGTITTYTAYQTGGSIAIERVVPITQETAYQRNDPFPERAHEQALDKLTMICQMLGGYFGLTPGSIRRALMLGKHDRDGYGAYQARNNRIADLGDPKTDTDAVNRRSMFSFVVEYVDRAIAGVSGGFGWFLQKGLGAIYRPFQSKMRDVVSVLDFITTPVDGTASNQEGIVAAVAAADALGAELNWPATEGDYISTGNIPGFHRVRHTGCGVIKRGADRFFISPSCDDTNRLYAANSGSAENDGLSRDAPMNSLKTAFDALRNVGGILNGRWIINLSGTFTGQDALSFPEFLYSRKLVEIQGEDVGGHPNVPITIIDASGMSVAALKIRDQRFLLTDILIKNLSASCLTVVRSMLCTDNVHTETINGFGFDIGFGAHFYMSGGIHRLTTSSPSDAIIRELFNVNHAIGYKYDESTGNPIKADKPIFIGSGTGRALTAREGCTGHARADFGTSEGGFLHGIEVGSNSRVHIDSDASFAKNQNAIWCTPGGDAQPDPGVNFNDGTPDANLRNIVFRQSSTSGTLYPKGVTETVAERLVAPGTAATLVGDTLLASWAFLRGSLKGIPAANYAGKSLRVRVVGNITGTAGTKRLTVRLSDVNGTTAGDDIVSVSIPSARSGQFVFECRMMSRTENSQRQETSVLMNNEQPMILSGNLSLDLGGPYQFLKVIGQISSGGDQISLSSSVTIYVEG